MIREERRKRGIKNQGRRLRTSRRLVRRTGGEVDKGDRGFHPSSRRMRKRRRR
jgi:hypothetical protein